jgi:aarF domain-containing kinase
MHEWLEPTTRNAEKAQANFRDVYTSLHIPEVLAATKRLLIMEFIDGGRVDDLDFLAEANIDRNKVSNCKILTRNAFTFH